MFRSIAGALVLCAFALLPAQTSSPSEAIPSGGINWLCMAYGALAGAAIMSGNVVGAAGLTLGAANAGCFG